MTLLVLLQQNVARERALPADSGKDAPPRADIHRQYQQLRQSLVCNSAFLAHLSISFYLRSNVAVCPEEESGR
jgi:hypothetical protein